MSVSKSKILLVGPVPQWRPSLPRVMIKPEHWNKNEITISDSGLDLDIMNTEKLMIVQDAKNNFEYISLINKLCKTNKLNNNDYSCRVRTNTDDLIQVDYGHLSRSGSLFVVDEILAEPINRLYNN